MYITKINKDYECDNKITFGEKCWENYDINHNDSDDNELFYSKKEECYYYFSEYIRNKIQIDKNHIERVRINHISKKRKIENNKMNNLKKVKELKMKHKMEHPEYQYLQCVKKIMNEGIIRDDRTKTGTKSIFGYQMRFDLSNNVIPVITTKRVFVRGVIEELLWFLRGDTDAKKLQEKGVKIWDGNTSREFLDGCGFINREIGDSGPIYGFNFRHFGAEYKDCNTDYSGKGVDQLRNALELIKNNPNSRRIIINLWNPSQLDEVVLPACHTLYQFYVANGKLSLSMYQRSADISLGVPFNITSCAILLRIMAKCSNLDVGELVYSLGDTHIHLNHMDGMKIQLQREPRDFPTLVIMKEINTVEDIEKLEYKDFKITGYKPHKSIKMKMAI